MRLAILADTHMPRGRRRLPEACRHELAAADVVFHLGDFSERSVLAHLERTGAPVVAVHGNVDSAELRALLPATAQVELEGVAIALVHDAGSARGRLARLRRRFPAADVVLFGHSHLPVHERDENGFEIFNPGSPTERRRAPTRSMGLAEVEDGGVRLRHLTLD